MRLRDVASTIAVDPQKLTDYALDPDHPVGRQKGALFESVLGYTASNWRALLRQLEHLAPTGEATLWRTDSHGRHYRVDLEIEGPSGERAVVRTGWIVAHGSNEARLTTLYVR